LVLEADLTWVGPPPGAMEAMARKIEARKTAAAAGVPVLPELNPAAVTRFPVLVKASAGGGGRGMRAIYDAADLPDAIASAQREAQAAFGDGTVFCEPLLTGARHVEVQVLADHDGMVWALTERDCSVQRRYAKVIEETPSPAVGPALRDRLLSAATALSRAVGYVSAGTVEFLVGEPGPDGEREFYFLEFNTRLQVEHPVTECVHGLDLVGLQLAIADGRPLPGRPPPPAGHAIEARLYAEDPTDGFRPAAGRVQAIEVPGADTAFRLPPGFPSGGAAQNAASFLRLDAGVEPGSVVAPHYDALLAKLIAWAPDRDAAVRRLAAALASARLAGPRTNRDLLVSVLRGAAFGSGQADTSLLAGYDYAALVPSEQTCKLAAAAAAAAVAAANRRDATAAASIPGGWRNVPSQPQLTCFTGPRGLIEVRYRWTGAGIAVTGPDGQETGVSAAATGPEQAFLEHAGVRRPVTITRAGRDLWVHSPAGSVHLVLAERLPAPQRAAQSGSLVAPMPGSVSRVTAAQGDRVAAGQLVLILEAMKMEHQITAPAAGYLAELRVSQGSQVNPGDVLAIVTADPPEGSRGSSALPSTAGEHR
jgi:acyl-CoA carboxylase subunit alpha